MTRITKRSSKCCYVAAKPSFKIRLDFAKRPLKVVMTSLPFDDTPLKGH